MKGLLFTATARVLWRMPGRFRLARLAQPKSALRCVLFHHIAPFETDFTRGLGVTMSAETFEDRLRFLKRWYTPIDLKTVLTGMDRDWDRPPVLVTFDDAYGSILSEAAPICRSLGVPAVLFANSGLLGNRVLAHDNFLAFVFNTQGLAPIERAAGVAIPSFKAIFEGYLPSLTLEQRREFVARLSSESGVDPEQLAASERLYLDPEDLAELPEHGVEIGNHTSTHSHLRSLTLDECREEVSGNKAELERTTGLPVNAFSYPYGSRADATEQSRAIVRDSGHTVVFLVHGLPNKQFNLESIYRVSLKSTDDPASFLELEVLPSLRALRRRIRA